MPIINIDTDNLPEHCRTAESLRRLADVLAADGDDIPASILRHLSDAMPVPLPTTPGSQVRCDGDEWTLYDDDVWRCCTSQRVAISPDALADLGPFEVIRDAGVA